MWKVSKGPKKGIQVPADTDAAGFTESGTAAFCTPTKP